MVKQFARCMERVHEDFTFLRQHVENVGTSHNIPLRIPVKIVSDYQLVPQKVEDRAINGNTFCYVLH